MSALACAAGCASLPCEHTGRGVPFSRVAPTVAQLRALEAVRRLQPTAVRDVSREMGLSAAGALDALEGLRAKGLVTWERGKQRTLRVVGGAR